MKLWWVYAGDDYYPTKVTGDLKDTFETEWEADDYASTLKFAHDWVEVKYVGGLVGANEPDDSDRWMSSGVC